jgi:hypothetical protein
VPGVGRPVALALALIAARLGAALAADHRLLRWLVFSIKLRPARGVAKRTFCSQ